MKVVGINGSPRLLNFSVRILDIQQIGIMKHLKGREIWTNQS